MQVPDQAWLREDGLASLLRHAREYPLQPWDVDPDDGPQSSFGRLIEEARRVLAREASHE
jgi:hypothetical protein